MVNKEALLRARVTIQSSGHKISRLFNTPHTVKVGMMLFAKLDPASPLLSRSRHKLAFMDACTN